VPFPPSAQFSRKSLGRVLSIFFFDEKTRCVPSFFFDSDGHRVSTFLHLPSAVRPRFKGDPCLSSDGVLLEFTSTTLLFAFDTVDFQVVFVGGRVFPRSFLLEVFAFLLLDGFPRYSLGTHGRHFWRDGSPPPVSTYQISFLCFSSGTRLHLQLM